MDIFSTSYVKVSFFRQWKIPLGSCNDFGFFSPGYNSSCELNQINWVCICHVVTPLTIFSLDVFDHTGAVQGCLEFDEFCNQRLCHESRWTPLVTWCIHEYRRRLWPTENVLHSPVFMEGLNIQIWCHWSILNMCWFLRPQVSSGVCYEDDTSLHLV